MIKLYKNQLFTLMLIFAFSPVSTFAVELFGKDNEIWIAGVNQYIKYADLDSSKYGNNDHPVEINAIDIRYALKALQYTEKSFLKGEHLKSVFSVSQINTLSKQIAKGLRQADPTKDLAFVLQGSDKELLILTKKYAVAGRIFYSEGKLNIILGEHDLARNDAFEKAYDPGGQRELPYNFNHGKRSSDSNRFTGALLGIVGVNNKRINNDLRQDWITIDVALASKTYLANKNKKENASTTKLDRKLEQETAKLAKQRREMRSEMARMRKQVQEVSNKKEPSPLKSVEERMTVLDQLLGKELITKKEYDVKRKEILNDI